MNLYLSSYAIASVTPLHMWDDFRSSRGNHRSIYLRSNYNVAASHLKPLLCCKRVALYTVEPLLAYKPYHHTAQTYSLSWTKAISSTTEHG